MKVYKVLVLGLLLLTIISGCSSLAFEREDSSIEQTGTVATKATENDSKNEIESLTELSGEENESTSKSSNVSEETVTSENAFVSKNSSTDDTEDTNTKTPREASIVVTVIFIVVLGCAFAFLLYDKKLLLIVIGISCLLFVAYLVFATDTFCHHTWLEATCEAPKTCSKCGKTEGEALGHDVENFTVTKKATCKASGSQTGTCNRCGKTIIKTIPQLEHMPDGESVIIEKATYRASGKKAEHCLLCGQACNITTYSLTEKEKQQDFLNSCTRYSYKTLARNPDIYRGSAVKVAGEVVQGIENGNEIQMRVNITKDEYGFYEDTVYVYYTKTSSSRILEDDIIAIYGTMLGTVTYTTVLGADVTIPAIQAKKIDVISDYSYSSI